MEHRVTSPVQPPLRNNGCIAVAGVTHLTSIMVYVYHEIVTTLRFQHHGWTNA